MIKKIHQIWVGDKPIPEQFQAYSKQLRKLNPEYEYKLWTDHDFEPFMAHDEQLREWMKLLETKQSKYYVYLSDFLRCWVVNRFGGWYFDTDMEFVKPLSALNVDAKHVFASYQSEPLHTYSVFNCCFYSKPNSAYLKELMPMLSKDDFAVVPFHKAFEKVKDRLDYVVLDEEYLLAKNYDRQTDKTVALHHAANTWSEK